MGEPKATLLMIHGLVGSLEYFQPGERFEHAEVHAVDLLGYGTRKDTDARLLTLHAQAEHVATRLATHEAKTTWLLGHSMGGAVAMLVADRQPERVAGVINIEGNFTLKDAFWSASIIAKSVADWRRQYRVMRADVHRWLVQCGVEPNPQRVAWATGILDNQSAGAVYAMSRAIVEETGAAGYIEAVRRVVDRGIPVHLIAGVRSAEAWDVPLFVRDAAQSYTEMANTGHLMMLEDPAAFCRTVDAILASGGG